MLDTASAPQTSTTLDRSKAERVTIDPEDMAHIQAVLTNVYSFREDSVLREYAVNALDSHIAAGQTRPVEITLPTEMEPTLTIRDYGTGLSLKSVLCYFGKYGKSSKRDRPDQTGRLGLGAKSGWSISDQYTVTAILDGMRWVVLFTIDETGAGTHLLVDERPTDEPNGVTIQIGIKNVAAMVEASATLFDTWVPGTVLVDGQQPESMLENAWQVEEGLHLLPGRNDITVVMGAIRYPVPEQMITNAGVQFGLAKKELDMLTRWGGAGLLITAPIGAVDHTPSREALQDSDRTLKFLTERLTDVRDRVVASAQKAIDESTDFVGTLMDLAPVGAAVPMLRTRLRHNGKPLDQNVLLRLPSYRLYTRSGGGRAMSNAQTREISWYEVRQVVVVTGVPAGKKITTAARNYLKGYDSAPILVAAPDTEGTLDWIAYGPNTRTRTIPYEQFLETATTHTPHAQQKAPISYWVHDATAGQSGMMRVDQINAFAGPVFFTRIRFRFTPRIAVPAAANALIVLLSASHSVPVLRERCPSAQSYVAAEKEQAQRVLEAAGPDVPLRADQQATLTRLVATLGPISRILGDRYEQIDPRGVLGKAEATARRIRSAMAKTQEESDEVKTARAILGVTATPAVQRDLREWIKREIPLLDLALVYAHPWHSADSRVLDMLLDQINAAPIDGRSADTALSDTAGSATAA